MIASLAGSVLVASCLGCTTPPSDSEASVLTVGDVGPVQGAQSFANTTSPIDSIFAQASGTGRVAVLDFDVHHGNGTEAILAGLPNMAFASVHQHPCYPGTGAADVGGNCFNHPVAPEFPRLEYRKVLSRALERVMATKPHLLGVSAGFDAYARDPIAHETLELEDFHWLGGEIRRLGVPVFSLLEGGYSDDLPELILAYLKGIAGK